MATILMRARYNEISQRNMQTPGWGREREQAQRALCEKAGCKFIGAFMSLVTGEAVVMIEGEIEQASYFSQQGVRPSDEPWSFDEWQQKDERLSVITAELWMELYDKYSAEEADRYWNDVKQAALKKFQSEG